ncbi:MAG: heme A synthase [Cyanobacteria bacterium J06627_15]
MAHSSTSVACPASSGPSASSEQKVQFSPQTFIRRWIWKMAAATLALMAVGSATRVMNAGLACPDWPLCYGQLVPSQQMNLQVFLEWFHRLDASLIGLMAVGLVGLSLWFRQRLSGWVPWAAVGVLLLIGVQGVLGGLTVTQLLRFDIVTAHLGTALLFFCSLLVMGTMLMPYRAVGTAGRLPWLGGLAAVLIYGQSLLGGLVASRWAAHQCFGLSQLCDVMSSHRWGAIVPTSAIALLLITVWRTPALDGRLRQLANAAGLLVVVQILLGIATLRLRLQIEPLTVSHQAIGATLLGVLVIFTSLAIRDRTAHCALPKANDADTASFDSASPA